MQIFLLQCLKIIPTFSGLIEPIVGKIVNENHSKNVKVWFDRANAFLYEHNLKNVDMAVVFQGNFDVSFQEDNQTPVPSEVLTVLKQHYGEKTFNSYTFVQVNVRNPN